MDGKGTFGSFIARRRKELHITQKAMAEQLFITESAVSKWERGITYPDISLVKDICEVLQVSESELFSSSLDLEKRKREKLAEKYIRLLKGYRMVMYIAYGITIGTCFICNIAISHSLDWFFIVLTSLMVAGSLTLVPAVVEKKKGLYVLSSFTASLLILLFTCNLYVQGDWFIVSAVSVLFGFAVVFLPYVLYRIELPNVLSSQKGLLAMAIDTVLLFILIVTIGTFINVGVYYRNAILITLFGLIYPWVIFLFLRYTKLNVWVKAAVSVVFTGIYTAVVNDVLSIIIENKYSITLQHANWAVWNEDTVNANITLIILLSTILIGAVITVIGIRRKNTLQNV